MKYFRGLSLVFCWLGCVLPLQAQGVNIPDKNLEAALRAALHEAKAPLTEQMLGNVFVLEAKGKKIANLTGLEKCKNLALLNLAKNKVSNLAPLKDLTNLQSLDLAGNKISDLRPLGGLPSADLGASTIGLFGSLLGQGPFTAESALFPGRVVGLTKLSYLELSDNQISNVEPLRNLTALSALYLTNNKISNIKPLETLTRLSSLSLGKNHIKDIKALEKVNKVDTLELKENQIEDITPLAKLTEIRLLMIEKNKIKDLTPLVNSAKADSAGPMRFAPFLDLYLEGNPLSDDAKTKQLEELKKYGVRIKG
jgi:hypothetical protein